MREFLEAAKAVADESRARILMFLRGGELCVCQVIEMLRLAPSTVSNHLRILHRAGLIETRKDGRWMYYRLAGRDATKTVRETIRWVQVCLKETSAIGDDAKRLQNVRGTDVKRLCERYHTH